ncbi:hypothetical protein D3C87_1671760 [compost metagenome]
MPGGTLSSHRPLATPIPCAPSGLPVMTHIASLNVNAATFAGVLIVSPAIDASMSSSSVSNECRCGTFSCSHVRSEPKDR